MNKWEVNKTPYPQVIGSAYELFRKWSYEMDGGLNPRTLKTFRRVDRMMRQPIRLSGIWNLSNIMCFRKATCSVFLPEISGSRCG